MIAHKKEEKANKASQEIQHVYMKSKETLSKYKERHDKYRKRA
jgi:hypothetical protein